MSNVSTTFPFQHTGLLRTRRDTRCEPASAVHATGSRANSDARSQAVACPLKRDRRPYQRGWQHLNAVSTVVSGRPFRFARRRPDGSVFLDGGMGRDTNARRNRRQGEAEPRGIAIETHPRMAGLHVVVHRLGLDPLEQACKPAVDDPRRPSGASLRRRHRTGGRVCGDSHNNAASVESVL